MSVTTCWRRPQDRVKGTRQSNESNEKPCMLDCMFHPSYPDILACALHNFKSSVTMNWCIKQNLISVCLERGLVCVLQTKCELVINY